MSHISDITDYLVTQGVATAAGTDIFDNYLPDVTGTHLAVIDTGMVMQDTYLPVDTVTFQVYIRADSYATGQALLLDVKDALHRETGVTIGSTKFLSIMANGGGGVIENPQRDDTRGQVELSINFIGKIRNERVAR